VIRLKADDIGAVDVLLDTTTTEKNLQCLAVVPFNPEKTRTAEIAGFVAEKLDCPYLG